MKAYQQYPHVFNSKNLKIIFDEKIALSSAVGRDGIKKGIFADSLESEIDLILSKVEAQTYHFTGYKEKLISKGAKSLPRQISIPTVRDRVTLRAVCDLISTVFSDSKLSPPHEFIKNIKEITTGLKGDYSFVRMDIMGYYPSINQKILLRRIRKRIRKPQIISLIDKAIKTPTGKKNTSANQSLEGVPQGLSISNILSAVYLAHIDDKYRKITNYFRYVDDILVICKSSDAHQIYEDLRTDIRRTARLKCHPLDGNMLGKTKITTISEGIDYLGFNITDKGVSVRRSSYKRMFSNLIKVFTQYKYIKNKKLFLWRLNLKISGCIFEDKRLGWMFFFSQTENISQLKRLDVFVKKLAVRYGLKKDADKIKTFVKTYHEIRFNAADTKYIPDFQEYSIEEKINFICLLTRKTREEVAVWDVLTIEEEFRKCASREVAQLEKDLLEVFS